MSRAGTRRDQGREITDKEKEIFLDNFRVTGFKKGAAEVAGRSVSGFRLLEKRDKEFAKEVADARAEVIDMAEGEAVRRAVLGFEEDQFFKGEKVGTIRRYSDRLLEMILRGNMPQVYGFKQEHTGKDGSPLMPKAADDIEAARRIAFLLTKGGKAADALTSPNTDDEKEPHPTVQ